MTLYVLAEPGTATGADNPWVYEYDDNLAFVRDNTTDPEWQADVIENPASDMGGIGVTDGHIVVNDVNHLRVLNPDLMDYTKYEYIVPTEDSLTTSGACNTMTVIGDAIYALLQNNSGIGTPAQLAQMTAGGTLTGRRDLPGGVSSGWISYGDSVGRSIDGQRIFIIAANELGDTSVQVVWEYVISTGVVTQLFDIPTVDAQIDAGAVTWGQPTLDTATGITEDEDGSLWLCGRNATFPKVARNGALLGISVAAHEEIGGSIYGMTMEGSIVWAGGNDGLYKIDVAADDLLVWVDVAASGMVARHGPAAVLPGSMQADPFSVRIATA